MFVWKQSITRVYSNRWFILFTFATKHLWGFLSFQSFLGSWERRNSVREKRGRRKKTVNHSSVSREREKWFSYAFFPGPGKEGKQDKRAVKNSVCAFFSSWSVWNIFAAKTNEWTWQKKKKKKAISTSTKVDIFLLFFDSFGFTYRPYVRPIFVHDFVRHFLTFLRE